MWSRAEAPRLPWIAFFPHVPMSLHGHVVLYLWCAQPILQSAVAVVLWIRKLHKQFPVFFWFLLAQIANFACVFPCSLMGNAKMYFVFFWLGEAVDAFLGFKVIHEIFLDVFRPYHTLKDLGTLLFKWAGIVMLLVSLVVAFSNASPESPVFQALTTLQRSVRVVQVGLILFLILFSRFLGVSRKQFSFGLSLGFGFVAGVELTLLALRSGGFVTYRNLNLINMSASAIAILIWFGYALPRKAARGAAVNRLQTERWEQGLADLQPPVPSDSLIPMFEGMVERAFSRSSTLELAENQISPNSSDNPPKTNSAAAGSKTPR
jgi:hypothetical protein